MLEKNTALPKLLWVVSFCMKATWKIFLTQLEYENTSQTISPSSANLNASCIKLLLEPWRSEVSVSGSVRQGFSGCCLHFLLLQSNSIISPSFRAPHLCIDAFVCGMRFNIYIYVTAHKIKIYMLKYTYSCICSSCVWIRTRSREQLEVFCVNACILIGIIMTL